MDCVEMTARFRRVKRLVTLVFIFLIIINFCTSELASRRVGLTILEVGNPILHRPASAVKRPTAEDQAAIAKIKDYLAKKPLGVAIAAPQVGLNRQFFVLKDGDVFHVLYNPRIVRHSRVVEAWPEKCLSISYTVNGVVPRYTEIEVCARDEDWRLVTIDATGQQARIMQHEIDHLRGITILDRVVSGPALVGLTE